MSITAATAQVAQNPQARSGYLTAPWTGDAPVYGGDQWPDNNRGSTLAVGFNHAYSGSSFYPARTVYPAQQPEIDGGSGFPGRVPSERNLKLKSEHLPVVGVC